MPVVPDSFPRPGTTWSGMPSGGRHRSSTSTSSMPPASRTSAPRAARRLDPRPRISPAPDAFTRHGRRFHEHGLAIARREAGAVIVPSAFTARRARRRRLRAVTDPPGGAGDNAPTDSTDDRRAPLGGPRYLLVPGTIEPRKGHALIVEAFARRGAACRTSSS